MSKRVSVYGDANVDLILPGVREVPEPGTEVMVDKMQLCVGGGAALFALGLAKLSEDVSFFGKLGRDMYGDFVVRTMEGLGISTRGIEILPDVPTGVSISFTDSNDRSFVTLQGSNSRLSYSDFPTEAIFLADHIHLTGYMGETNHEEFMELVRKIRRTSKATISLDTGWDPTEKWSEKIFELIDWVDVLFMNETECKHYTRCENVKDGIMLLSKHVDTIAIKCGAKGSVGIQNGVRGYANPIEVNAIDTTGAGDSFNAGFIHGYLNGYPIDKALQAGNICGAYACTAYGGNTAFPMLEELENNLNCN